MQDQNPTRDRLFRLGKGCGIVLAVGVAYYAFVSLTGFGIPCPILWITGAYCPGCGITRACVCLLHGDFSGALAHNALVVLLLPLLLAYGVYAAIRYVRGRAVGNSRWELVFWLVALVLTVAFWIVRNTAWGAVFAP